VTLLLGRSLRSGLHSLFVDASDLQQALPRQKRVTFLLPAANPSKPSPRFARAKATTLAKRPKATQKRPLKENQPPQSPPPEGNPSQSVALTDARRGPTPATPGEGAPSQHPSPAKRPGVRVLRRPPSPDQIPGIGVVSRQLKSAQKPGVDVPNQPKSSVKPGVVARSLQLRPARKSSGGAHEGDAGSGETPSVICPTVLPLRRTQA